MPHKEDLIPKTHAFRNLMGQIPLTHVKDYQSAIDVSLVKHDNYEDMLKGTYGFVKATWSTDGLEAERATEKEMTDALDQMLSGKTLQLGLETVSFIFRIRGITRIDTHQIVRQRIGVTFSQQCSGDQFWNHQNMLVEPCILYSDRWRSFISTAISCKMQYSSMVSSGISIQAARSILPHCLETFIFMKVDLATLLFFHQKRIDDGSQTWQINRIADLMATRVCEVFPQLTEVFERNKTRFKFQTEASKDRTNTFSTGLYLPNPDTFDYHRRDFLYNATKNEMHLIGPEPVGNSAYFFGNIQINQEVFEDIKSMYAALDERNKRDPYLTNDQIIARAEEINDHIFSKYKDLLGANV